MNRAKRMGVLLGILAGIANALGAESDSERLRADLEAFKLKGLWRCVLPRIRLTYDYQNHLYVFDQRPGVFDLSFRMGDAGSGPTTDYSFVIDLESRDAELEVEETDYGTTYHYRHERDFLSFGVSAGKNPYYSIRLRHDEGSSVTEDELVCSGLH